MDRQREIIWFEPNLSLARYALLAVNLLLKSDPRYSARRKHKFSLDTMNPTID